jgi:hypothetical protein
MPEDSIVSEDNIVSDRIASQAAQNNHYLTCQYVAWLYIRTFDREVGITGKAGKQLLSIPLPSLPNLLFPTFCPTSRPLDFANVVPVDRQRRCNTIPNPNVIIPKFIPSDPMGETFTYGHGATPMTLLHT